MIQPYNAGAPLLMKPSTSRMPHQMLLRRKQRAKHRLLGDGIEDTGDEGFFFDDSSDGLTVAKVSATAAELTRRSLVIKGQINDHEILPSPLPNHCPRIAGIRHDYRPPPHYHRDRRGFVHATIQNVAVWLQLHRQKSTMASLNGVVWEFRISKEILTELSLHELGTLRAELAVAVEDAEEVVVRARTEQRVDAEA